MDKQDNPYLNLLQIMEKQSSSTPQNFIVGVVVKDDPLNVKIKDNIVLDKDDVLVNDFLLPKYNRKIKVKTPTSNVDISSTESMESEIETLDNYLKIGDKVVLLISEDQQQFILLCKVR